MTMNKTPEQIAAGLSDAQRRLVLWLHPTDFRDWLASGKSPGHRSTRRAVADLTEYAVNGVVDQFYLRRLNTIGREVAAILQAQENTNAD